MNKNLLKMVGKGIVNLTSRSSEEINDVTDLFYKIKATNLSNLSTKERKIVYESVADELVEKGYLPIAMAFYNLSNLTKKHGLRNILGQPGLEKYKKNLKGVEDFRRNFPHFI